MPRYRTINIRTEEEKRNFKVDLRRVPEWKAELGSIHNHFLQFDLANVVSAAFLIQDIREVLYLVDLRDREKERQSLKKWETSISVEKLIDISADYVIPNFLYYGTIKHYGRKINLIDEIRGKLKEAENEVAKFKAKGVSDSFLVQMLTSKVSPELIQSWEAARDRYRSLLQEAPKIEQALNLLSQVHQESRKYAGRVSQIKKFLSSAEEKKTAIERFEAKHGAPFAKAASVDNKTRSRATTLRQLVKKTPNCPYCERELGENPHLDHIYPVSKGGLSIFENLIWCCSTCNTLKNDKGLMQFLIERDAPVEQVLSRLHSLGKHV